MRRRVGHPRAKRNPLPVDPYEAAKFAGLRYVRPEGPGITRRKAGRGFTFIGVNGRPICDAEELRRIHSLVIPPAWTNVWICPSKNGHIQAVGRDARGRKQYRYHPLYRAVRDATKFARMAGFGEALPAIRKKVQQDLELAGLPRERVLATVVRLLEKTCIRVGNEEYAKENDSYGLTTMLEKHVDIRGPRLRFHFRGKSGLVHDIELTDRRVAHILRKCQCLPGEELFQYVDDDGSVHAIYSDDVNDYLRQISGQDFTAKDFRTWAGTGQAILSLQEMGLGSSATESKKNIVAAVKMVAEKLGNKPATCRKYYIHPAIFDSYANGGLLKVIMACPEGEPESGLRKEEICILKLVQAVVPEAIMAA